MNTFESITRINTDFNNMTIDTDKLYFHGLGVSSKTAFGVELTRENLPLFEYIFNLLEENSNLRTQLNEAKKSLVRKIIDWIRK